MIFYRYIRPVIFQVSRCELITQATGGVCLRFNIGECESSFSYARCHKDDLFSKSTAKAIADNRAKYFVHQLPLTGKEDTKELVEAVLHYCETSSFSHKAYLSAYLKREMRELAFSIMEILVRNKEEECMADVYTEAFSSRAVKNLELYKKAE